MEQSLKKTAVHMYGLYSTPVAFASHPRRSIGLARRSPNGMHVILRLHTHVGPQLRTDHRHTPRPRKSGELIEERDKRSVVGVHTLVPGRSLQDTEDQFVHACDQTPADTPGLAIVYISCRLCCTWL